MSQIFAKLALGVLGLALGWITPGLRAAEPNSFATGNAKYAVGDFAGAAKDYEAQVGHGEINANLFYNLGDAYYRAGDRGRALLNYRRALWLDPAQAEAAANLAFVNGGKAEIEAHGGAESLWNVVAVGLAAGGWLVIVGLLAWLFGRHRRGWGIAGAAGGLLLCALGAGAFWWRDGDRYAPRAVVIIEAAPALYSPVEGAKVVTTLPLGGEVRLLSDQGAWSYVLLPDGTTRAWLSSRAFERFVPR